MGKLRITEQILPKVLTETFMLYILGNGEDLAVADIMQFYRIAANIADPVDKRDPATFVPQRHFSYDKNSSEARMIGRYMEDLKKIGALFGDTERQMVTRYVRDFITSLGDSNENEIAEEYIDTEESYIRPIYYSTNLIPYNEEVLNTMALKIIYRIAKIMNTKYDENANKRKYLTYLEDYYYSNGIPYGKDERGNIYLCLQLIGQMLEIWENFDPDCVVWLRNWDDLTDGFYDIKNAWGYGFNPIINKR